MTITWDEARKLNADLAAKQAQADAEQQLTALVARFPVGSKARITRRFHESRAWGDLVTITYHVVSDDGEGPAPMMGADHETYGDVGWLFLADELEPVEGAGA